MEQIFMQRKSDIFRAKAAQHLCLGMLVTMTDSAVVEAAAEAGFDFIWIDAEHGALSAETIDQHIRASRAFDCAPLVRVQWNEWGVIKPILDMAPAGVIVPMVNTAEDAEAAVSACRYPPLGTRGCGPRRGNRFGMQSFDEYLADSQRDPLIILQIEHIDAVINLDKILAVPGIDSICIGPADLSASMNKFCKFEDPEVIQVLDEISDKVKKHDLLLGTADWLSPRWKKRPLDWIACSSDVGMIAGNGSRLIKQIREENI